MMAIEKTRRDMLQFCSGLAKEVGGANNVVPLLAMLLKSRHWRDDQRNDIRHAANNSVFKIGKLG